MKHSTLSIIRWAARIIGTLMVIFTLIIAIGEMLEGISKPKSDFNTYTIILFVIWGAGLAGLILALWKEGLGGIISLLCFIIFNVLAAINTTPGSSYTSVLLLFMIPSILYLVYWRLERDSSSETIDSAGVNKHE
jgi:peptidoglycan/LPS O-acetylase OafA/YrhL